MPRTQLALWLRKQALKEARRGSLPRAVLTREFGLYAWYRLRFIMLRTSMRCLVHGIEFLFLNEIFHNQSFATLAILFAISTVVSTAWWGALDLLREQIRRQTADGRIQRNAEVTSEWLSLATILSAAIALIVGSVIAVFLHHDDSTERLLFAFTGAVIVARLCFNLLYLTFHSAVYAVRRIYTPVEAGIGIELIGLLVLFVVRNQAPTWAFPMMLLFTTAAQTYVSTVYLFHAYAGLRWPNPVIQPWSASKRLFRKVSLASLLLRLGAAFAMALDGLLLLASIKHVPDLSIVKLLFVVSPVVHASRDWVTTFYFDFKRLEVEEFDIFAKRFQQLVARLAWLVGFACWVLSGITVWILLGLGTGRNVIILLPLFLLQSRVAYSQLRAFSNGQFKSLIYSSLVLLVAWKISSTFVYTGIPVSVLLAVLVGLALLILEIANRFLARLRPGRLATTPDKWLRKVSLTENCRIGSASLNIKNPRDLRSLLRVLHDQLDDLSHVCVVGLSRLFWYETGEESEGRSKTGEAILSSGAQFVQHINRFEKLYSRDEGFAKRLSSLMAIQQTSESASLVDVKKRFYEEFPAGTLLFLPVQKSSFEKHFSSGSILREALYFASHWDYFPGRRRRDIGVLCRDGTIHYIFVLPWNSASREKREAWVATVRDAMFREALTR